MLLTVKIGCLNAGEQKLKLGLCMKSYKCALSSLMIPITKKCCEIGDDT